jgi:hypothetical protein
MGLLDVLRQYQQRPNQPPPHVIEDFDRVAREADPEDLSYGLEEAFNDDDTPPFEEMTAQLYERSDPDTRAGLLDLLGRRGQRDLPVSEVQSAAARSAQQNPGVIQQISRFYARHPQVVQVLGQAALSVLMSGMARRRRF